MARFRVFSGLGRFSYRNRINPEEFFSGLAILFFVTVSLIGLIVMRRFILRRLAKHQALPVSGTAQFMLDKLQEHIQTLNININSLSPTDSRSFFEPMSYEKSIKILRSVLKIHFLKPYGFEIKTIYLLEYKRKKSAKVFLECNADSKRGRAHLISISR